MPTSISSAIIGRPSPRACSRSWRRWASRRCSPTRAGRSSRRSALPTKSSSAASAARPAASKASISPCSPRKRCAATRSAIRTTRPTSLPSLPNPGEFHWRSAGERHTWDPQAIFSLQVAARRGDKDAYKRFAAHINEEARKTGALRGLLDVQRREQPPMPLDEVEPASEIVKRFCTGAMSFGSHLGRSARDARHRDEPHRRQEQHRRRRRRPRAVQAAAERRLAAARRSSRSRRGRFGVTIKYLANADELQIKMAQGAKPGEGGELPGQKVDDNIARIRYSTPGVGLISPPPHHDIYSIEDLGAADPRPEEREPDGAHQREARVRSRRRHDRGRRRQRRTPTTS